FCLFFLLPLRPPSSTLFPYTTLFRSNCHHVLRRDRAATETRPHIEPPIAISQRLGMGDQLMDAARGEDGVFVLGDIALVVDLQRSEEHTSELQSRENLVCRLLLEKKK